MMTYTGKIIVQPYEECDDALFLSHNLDSPLAEVLQQDIDGKSVHARYWVTDQECTRDEAQEQAIRRVMGDAGCIFQSLYSEHTGYLWTEQGICIGGHDVLAELQESEGKWIVLEVEMP